MRQKLAIQPGRQGYVWQMDNPLARRVSHQHSELEFNLVTRGEGTYLLSDRRYHLPAGSLVWLFPRQEHQLVNCSADLQLWVVVFRVGLVRRLARPDGPLAVLRKMNPPGDYCRRLRGTDRRELAGLLGSARRQHEDTVTLNAALAYLLCRAWRAWESACPMREELTLHPLVDGAVQWLNRADNPMTLTGLADQLHVSASYLSRLFSRQMGQSLSAYRSKVCLDRFFDLFEAHPDRRLLTLALQAGFGSYAQFHRIFRRLVGCCPRQWLKDNGPET
jgi:AraC-like DNA-binding protein